MAEKGFFLAQAIAFKSLVTVIPVAVLTLGILGRIFQSESNRKVISSLFRELIPTYLNDVVIFLTGLQSTSGTITFVGAAGSIFFATILCNTLCEALTVFFEGPYHRGRRFFARYAFSFRLVLQVGLAFFLTLLVSFVIQSLSAAGTSFLVDSNIDSIWVHTGWRRTIKFLGILIPFLLTFTVFFQLYFFIPKPHPPIRSVLSGTIVAACTWEIAKYFFSLYATHIAFFNRLQEESFLGLEALDDTVGLIIALLIWLYFTGITLIVGGIIVMLHEKRHFERIKTIQ